MSDKDRSAHFIKVVNTIGSIASILTVCMYASYIFNMIDFTHSVPGDDPFPIQTLVAFINCCVWSAYGFLLPKKNIPILVANVPGIFITLITIIVWFIFACPK